MPDLVHWFHIFAAGDWERPVTEHLDALDRSGLGAALASFHVGIVGTLEQRADVIAALDDWTLTDIVLADDGWEQVTLAPMWWWARDHDGLICYTHTKGAANYADINDEWRRDMEFHNVFEWRRIIESFNNPIVQVAGAHWITDPAMTQVGFFGGNFWWVRADLLRRGCRPKTDYRHQAEQWVGELDAITPLVGDAVFDLCPTAIAPGGMHPDW